LWARCCGIVKDAIARINEFSAFADDIEVFAREKYEKLRCVGEAANYASESKRVVNTHLSI